MAVVKSIGKFSALKVGFLVFAVLGLVAGLLSSGFAFAGMPLGLEARMGFKGIFVLLPLILCPLFYGIIGAIVTFVGALIYNLASRWTGGLEVDIV
jgi:hypothetical protein